MRRMTLFVALTALLSAPLWWLARQSGFYTALLMWCPGIAAAITVKLTRGSLAQLGWRGARLKWLVLASLVTLGYWSASYWVGWLLGYVGFPDSRHLASIARESFLYTGSSTALAVLIMGAYAATAGVVNGLGRALGEELGWRGLLVPEACARFGFARGALLTGLLWALWHYPLMIGEVPAQGFVNFTLLVTGIGVMYAWFRQRSGSVWPSTLMHAMHNALRSGLFGVLTFNTVPTSPLWAGETGYLLAGAGAVLLIVFGWLGTAIPSQSSRSSPSRDSS
jgi:membrane protease YdiL (CAAX protease family)